MKEQYIKQVEKELSLPHKAKKEVVRDLNEVFASALEHGETEQQVIQRLGTPKEFADSTAEQFGIDNASSKKRKGIISALVALIVAVVAFSIYAVTRLGKAPEGAIGQADATTNIQIESALGFDVLQIILAVGFAAAVIAVLIKLFRLHPQVMRVIYNLTVLPLLTRVSGLLMNTQRGFLFRPVQLHGQHLIQNMKIAVSTLPALATTTIASTWRF